MTSTEAHGCEYGSFVVQFLRIRKRSLKKRNKPGNGGVAQLGEHLPCKQGVMGSNPIISTSRSDRHTTGEWKNQAPDERKTNRFVAQVARAHA